MLGRFNFASRLSGDVGDGVWLDPQALLTASGAETMDQLVGYLAGALGLSLSQSTAQALFAYAGKGSLDRADVESKVRGLVHLMLVSPEYQAS
jgi:hypothetical protein